LPSSSECDPFDRLPGEPSLTLNKNMQPLSFLSLFVIGLTICQASNPCAGVSAEYASTCKELQSYLDQFNATIDAQWKGDKPPVAFGAELLAANDNRGLQAMLNPNTLRGVEQELDGLGRIGVKSVTIAVGFPTLYQPFYEYNKDPQDYQGVLNFYKSVMAEVRRRGLKVVIETSIMFGRQAKDLPLKEYYATLSPAAVVAGRAQVAINVAKELTPDWLNLGSEPDTQSGQLRLAQHYTPQQYAEAISAMVKKLRGAGVSGKPLIGAGVGTWQPDAAAYVKALGATPLDYIDLHIYSANRGFLAAAPGLCDLAHQAGKGVAISEAWLKKVTDAEVAHLGEPGEARVLGAPATTARNAYPFWAPLDSEFITTLVKLAYWKNLYYVSPFATQFFFSYAGKDYDANQEQGPRSMSRQRRVHTVTEAAEALRRGELSPTGLAYTAAINPNGAPGPGPSAAPHRR
jgi:hypothetical protein